MQRHLVFTAAALALAAGTSTHAAAQRRPVSVLVGIGPMQAADLGFLQGPGGGARGRLMGATAPTLGIQAPTPVRGVELRVAAQHGTPFLALDSAGGFVLRDRAHVTSVTADLVVNLPHVGPVRPYLLAGGGVRRYDFDQASYQSRNAAVVPADATVPLLHLGAGAAWKVGAAELFAEASLVSAHYSAPTALPGGRTVANVGYTLGIRIPLGRHR